MNVLDKRISALEAAIVRRQSCNKPGHDHLVVFASTGNEQEDADLRENIRSIRECEQCSCEMIIVLSGNYPESETRRSTQ